MRLFSFTQRVITYILQSKISDSSASAQTVAKFSGICPDFFHGCVSPLEELIRANLISYFAFFRVLITSCADPPCEPTPGINNGISCSAYFSARSLNSLIEVAPTTAPVRSRQSHRPGRKSSPRDWPARRRCAASPRAR